ncbi:LysR family transcriptional regulator [Natronospirillum operosum]|uniref:LysR family transcriptional regulator n=1 Tax=Natronospirillum operosum TaxID=2759953 RepID=A0A4Z0W9A9_9GAMM|nr:LysR family transcriptional regulator [Natronospirillum operosum]TGG91747.1 LysR family transcriptional regulator [Natronospirillum operosum]
MSDDLRTFCAVAEAEGFSAAANRLGIGKAAVSKAIKRLETQLETQLFHRSTRRISLTEAGEAYYHHARLAIQQLDAAADAVYSLGQEPRGRIKLTAPMSIGLAQITPIVAEFLAQFPGLSIDLHLDDDRVDLIGGGFDLAIRVGSLPDSDMMARQLGFLDSVLVASPEYLARRGWPSGPSCLADHECLVYSNERYAEEWVFQRHGATQAVDITPRFRVNSAIALHRAAVLGGGIARLPRYLARESLQTDSLVLLLADYRLEAQPLHVVYPERHFIPAKVRVLVNFIQDKLAIGSPQ